MMNYNISNQYIAAHRSTASSPADNSDQSVPSVYQSGERSSAVALLDGLNMFIMRVNGLY